MSNWKEGLIVSYAEDAKRRASSKTELWKIEERSRFMRLLMDEQKEELLEIGAGAGKDALVFQESGLRVRCIDLSPAMVKACQEKGLRAQVMDFYKLDFADAAFDAVYALNCLLHVPKSELDAVLREIIRVLKPGGLLYAGLYGGRDSEGIWDGDWCEPKRFFSFHTDDAMKERMERYFALEYFEAVPLKEGELHFQSMIVRKH